MHLHDQNFKQYIELCLSKNKQITFEGYLKSNKKYVATHARNDDKEFQRWFGWFSESALAFKVSATKEDAKLVWKEIFDKTTFTSTFDLKKRKIICEDFGPKDIEINQWKISGVDISETIKTKRRDTVALVEKRKPISETDYLLLSCVLEVPLEIYSFSLDINPKVFSSLRRTVCCLPLLEFDDDLLLKFLKIKKLMMRQIKEEEKDDNEIEETEEREEEEKEEEEEEEKEEEAEEKEEEAEEKEEEEKEEEAEEKEEETEEETKEREEEKYRQEIELLLCELTMDALKKKNNDAVALASVARRIIERRSWATVFTEESFIDQFLLPFVECVLLAEKNLVGLRSSGRIPLSNIEQSSSSSGIDSCKKMMPDFVIMMPFRESHVGFVAIEVKKGASSKSSQVLSDRSKLGLECKRMVDEQVIRGSESPRSFGILVCEFECRVFSCSLGDMGVYVFVEEETFSLIKNLNDLALLPDTVQVFCKIRKMVSQSMAGLLKKRKSRTPLRTPLKQKIKPTVALPTKSCLVLSTQ